MKIQSFVLLEPREDHEAELRYLLPLGHCGGRGAGQPEPASASGSKQRNLTQAPLGQHLAVIDAAGTVRYSGGHCQAWN